MSARQNTILFEVNELPFQVVDHFVRRNPNSHLARLLEQSKQFETVCEDQVELDPWISWPTLYRGVIDKDHKIFHLGQALDDADRNYPPVWQILARHGVKVGLMGSLHSSAVPPDLDNYAFYLPDFFANTTFAHPSRLAPFQAFNLAMTRKSTRNVDGGIVSNEALRFLATYPLLGMSLSTLSAIGEVLLSERRSPHLRARRRALQPLITLDLFLHLMKRARPGFATLHTNHVAAAMHRFWAATFPTDVAGHEMPAEWYSKYDGEIDYSMRVLDIMLGRLAKFVRRNKSYKLLVASSLGQAGVRTKPTKGFITIMNIGQLMRRLGFTPQQWTQRFAMAPQISVVLDESVADEFERKLLEISVGNYRMRASANEIPPLSFDRTATSFQLYFYFESYEGEPTAKLGAVEATFDELGLGFHAHQDEVACSGRHTPHGLMIVHDPDGRAGFHDRTQISTLDIAPALLDAYGISVPDYMRSADRSILDAGRRTARADLGVRGGGVERVVERLGVIGVGREKAS